MILLLWEAELPGSPAPHETHGPPASTASISTKSILIFPRRPNHKHETFNGDRAMMAVCKRARPMPSFTHRSMSSYLLEAFCWCVILPPAPHSPPLILSSLPVCWPSTLLNTEDHLLTTSWIAVVRTIPSHFVCIPHTEPGRGTKTHFSQSHF